MREQISAFFGVCAGVVAYFLGGFDAMLSVFVTILILDTFTGMLKAWNAGKYESSEFRKGMVHKISYLLGIILSTQIDKLVGSNGVLRDAVITFFIFNESMSIIENIGEMGVDFPPILTNAIKSLKDKNNPSIEETTTKEESK